MKFTLSQAAPRLPRGITNPGESDSRAPRIDQGDPRTAFSKPTSFPADITTQASISFVIQPGIM